MKPKITCTLNGDWNLKEKNGDIKSVVDVPGSVFEALIINKLIDDPFYGNNEQVAKEIYDYDWVFERKFDLDDNLITYKNLVLKFKGIDTFAEVLLNGTLLGTTDNMFRMYKFDIRSVVRKKDNILKVIIKSPVQKTKDFVDEYGVKLKTTHGMAGVPYIRKAQYSFGWDWGPVLPDIGIWKDVIIEAFDDLKIDSYYIDMDFSYNKDQKTPSDPQEYHGLNIDRVALTISTQLSEKIESDDAYEFMLKCSIKGPDEISQEQVHHLSESELKIPFSIEYPYLWWTHDLGKPNLYELDLSLYYKNAKVDFVQSKFGIREIKLVRNKDKWGETFYFTLNGIPIFAKGANWVPIDSFIPRGKKRGQYIRNIQNCVAVGFNFIRVWGGGVYEDDLFYDLCDEQGILVWQDLPFACAIYPIHRKFIDNVIQELIENVIRLRNHPSLALWCGNNEIEQLWIWLLLYAELKDSELRKEYENGYLNLFKEIIPNLIRKYDPQRSYWPSSALDNYDRSKELSANPNNPESGDSHFWKVWHGGASFKSYRKFDSRFMSEFGFESFPSIKTIKDFCPDEELYLDSPIMENHQKNEGGNQKIMRYMRKRFNIPKAFEKQIILSQITQAEAIQYGVEYWRQNRNDFHCMGSLYWQLNDCWPVASWSSFDYYGRWKALHYFARRFYAPLIPSVREYRESVEMWITNDYPSPQSVNYFWRFYDNQGKLLIKGCYEVEVPSCYSKCLETVEISELQSDSKRENIILFYGIDGETLTSGMRLFDAPKRFELKNPVLTWDFEKINANFKGLKGQIKIKTKNIALYVHITSDEYDFIASDNFFSMEPNEERTIIIDNIKQLQKDNSKTQNIAKEVFKVSSLFDLLE
jgi:beta-mannosidase